MGMTAWDIAAILLLALYVLDRAIKANLVARFFERPEPLPPADNWPTVALIQPVTRGATNLAEHLKARAMFAYPGRIRHIVACDTEDTDSQEICRRALPGARIVLATPDVPGAPLASKVAKMSAGVAHIANSSVDVICFVDDDILLPSNALSKLVAPLYTPKPAGATFGLACQTSWGNVWESLMSGFVNANALTGYVPLTFFVAPYTITGHVFALRWSVFQQTGGMKGLEKRFDDDHEIARRVRALGLPLVQTTLVYRVENALSSFAAYRVQMRRWFIMPRQAMVSYLSGDEKTVSSALSLGNLLPPLILFCAICAPEWITLTCAALAYVAFQVCYGLLEHRYLPARTPARRWILLPMIAFITPLHVLAALLLPGDRIEWRGQSYRARPGGGLEVSEKE